MDENITSRDGDDITLGAFNIILMARFETGPVTFVVDFNVYL